MDIKQVIDEVLEGAGVGAERVVLFGSRVRNDHTEDSDVDILIVSEDFEGVAYPGRSQDLYLAWPYSDAPSPEFVCLTPEEFRERRESDVEEIVTTIMREGRVLR